MADHYRVELGRAIKQRREQLGLTQKDLAERTHYKEAQTVSRWERGENSPGDLEAVAHALDWTLADLVAGIQPPDRRTARRLGAPLETPRSQLDRIEQRLEDLYELLTGDADGAATSGQAARVLEATVADIEKAAASPRKPAPGRQATPRAARRRSDA